MLDFDLSFVLVIVNFIILYLFLKWILFKPVTQFIEKRNNGIKKSIEEAEARKSEAAEMKKKYEDILNTAEEEKKKIISEAVLKANKEYEAIMGQARKESELLMASSKREIESERKRMIKGIKAEVVGMAIAAASKIIESNMDNETNKVLVEKFLDKEGAL